MVQYPRTVLLHASSLPAIEVLKWTYCGHDSGSPLGPSARDRWPYRASPAHCDTRSTMIHVDSGAIDVYLEQLWDHKGTDLLLTAACRRAADQRDDASGRRPGARRRPDGGDRQSLLPPRSLEEFEREKEPTSRSPGASRPASAPTCSVQQGADRARAAADPVRHPDVRRARPPADRSSTSPACRRGCVLVTGPTGSGKSTTLGVDDRLHQPARARATSSRSRTRSSTCTTTSASAVNQREVGVDTDSFARALRAGAPRGPRRHARRRDARPRDDPVRADDRRDRPPRVRDAAHQRRRARRSTASSTCSRPSAGPDPGAARGRARAASSSQRLVPRIGGGMVAAFEVLVATNAGAQPHPRGQDPPAAQHRRRPAMRDGMQTLEARAQRARRRAGVITYEDALSRGACSRRRSSCPPRCQTGWRPCPA